MLDCFVEPPYQLTITGTVRKNKREIPTEFKLSSKIIPDTKFCFSENIALLSYTPKKNKVVILASTYSKSTEITDGKPNIILHYNKTNANKINDLVHNHVQSVCSLTTDDITFSLMINSTDSVCGYTVFRTEHPKLVIFETVKGQSFAGSYKLAIDNLDLFT